MHSLATILVSLGVVASSLRIVVASSLRVVVSLLGTATSLLRILSASFAAHSWFIIVVVLSFLLFLLVLVVLVLPPLELRESEGSSCFNRGNRVNCTTLYSGVFTL